MLQQVKIKDLACDCSSFSSVLPWLECGWFEIGVHKRYVGARERRMEKRQVSYDPKDEAILDPIFAEATATDNPDRNPSQNFNGSDYFEASVRDVPLHTTFIVPAFLVQSEHRANSSFHRRIVFVPSDLFFLYILQYLHRIRCYISLKYAYEYGLKNLHLMHGLSCAWT